MATPGIRYEVIDLKPDTAVGIKIPFLTKTGILFDQSYSTQDQLLTNLKSLILTQPGERILQPQLGTYLREALFQPNNDELSATLRSNIQFAINYWIPYVTIDELNIENVIVTGSNREDEHGVKISLKVRVTGRASETPISFVVTPSGVEII